MKSLVIDAAVISNADAPANSANSLSSGLGADILHIIIDNRRLPDSLPPLEHFPRLPVGQSTASRIFKEYVLSCDPYKIAALNKHQRPPAQARRIISV
jgi:hypothetical protein